MTYSNIIINGILSDLTVDDGLITDISPVQTRHWDVSNVFVKPNDQSKLPCFGMARKRGCGETNLTLAIPSLVNMHTHSAMTLLRSAGSGMPLFQWLNEAIFPIEAKLSPNDIYHGALQACNEMANSGTSAFNDMYFSIESTIRAAIETNISGNIALSVTDKDFSDGTVARFVKKFDSLCSRLPSGNPQLSISLAPHAIYTVNGRNLQYAADFAKEHDTLFHIHLSETRKEREDCLREHGVPPVVYLDRLGIFDKVGSRFVGAHALWLDDDEIGILGSHHATVVHCPCSNLKLGSGFRFLYTELRDAGVNVTLGTDGSASSDNLNLVEAAKFMSLLQKGWRNDPAVLPADELFRVASTNGRRALRLPDNSIRPGNIADFFLIPLSLNAFWGVDYSQPPKQLHLDLLNRLFFASGHYE